MRLTNPRPSRRTPTLATRPVLKNENYRQNVLGYRSASSYHSRQMAADSDPDQQRLAKIYAGMTEGELRRAANNAFDLTDAAHQALIDEITRRSLDIPLVDSFAVDEVEQRQLVTVRHFRDLP